MISLSWRFLRQAFNVQRARRLLRRLVVDRLRKLALSRVTLDFDGSVQSTGRRAEGTAVGFNEKKKGARSDYPLFCTIAQTLQVLDFLHRSGNVHDSRGARAFIAECIALIREALPHAVIEVRADSAFFSDELVTVLRGHRVEFTLSVPFERFTSAQGDDRDPEALTILRRGSFVLREALEAEVLGASVSVRVHPHPGEEAAEGTGAVGPVRAV